MLVEAALIKLGTAAVRTATKLWLGDHKIAAEVGASAVDLLSDRLTTHRDKRKFNRMIENFAEEVVNRVEPIINREFRDLPENERVATVEAVHDTFVLASLADRDLFASDLDAGHLDRTIRARVSSQTQLLSGSGTALYDLLLRECCGYVIEIARGLPRFSADALTELLRRDREILDGIRDVLARLPPRNRASGFDYDYRQLVARKLDEVQMYGVTLSDASRRYPLSVAYISLTAATEHDSVVEESRIEDLLARGSRVFIRGEAGLGKTTLLHWIAVRSARADFRAPLLPWNDTVPFFLPLRRYSTGELPGPEKFLEEIGRHIADEMPQGWVHSLLRSGRAALLIDGVDEVVTERREAVRTWLSDLVSSFPRAKFVITSRPGGVPGEWLQADQFAVVDLQPMTSRDVRIFIERWHDAMRSTTSDTDSQAEITEYQHGLIAHLESHTHIRKLARYPLLCALLCALHKDRRAALPTHRMELYAVALEMMLDRRDTERKISNSAGLNRTEKTLLLGDLAYWLIRNGHSDIAVDRAKDRFKNRLRSMPQVTSTADAVYRHFLERSGLLREAVEGRVDFIHRTFQEYLAANAAMNDADDVGTVVANAHLDQWHEVVVMSLGCASRKQREELFSGLLARDVTDTTQRHTLDLLALASLETTPELSADLHKEIKRRASRLLPPKNLRSAKSFASAGPFVLDLLAKATPTTAPQAVATIHALAETGLLEAIPLLAKYRHDIRAGVRDELIKSWDSFDPEEYARQVLLNTTIDDIEIAHNIAKLRSLEHLLEVTSLSIIWKAGNDPDLTMIPQDVLYLKLKQVSDRTAGTIPVDFADLTHVTDLSSLSITAGTIENFSRLAELSQLTEIDIHATSIKPAGLNVADQTSIRKVTVTGLAGLTGLTQFRFLKNIEFLNLYDMANLSNLTSATLWKHCLQRLHISRCPVQNISGLADLHELQDLSLSRTHVDDISALQKMRQLRTLDLSHSPVSDISPLAGLTTLRSLDLRETRVTDISALHKLPNLVELHLPDSSADN